MSRHPAILRDVAAVVLRRRLGGRAFPLAVLRTRDPYGVRATPEPVRRLAALIRFRGANLSPEGVACVLRSRARQLQSVRKVMRPLPWVCGGSGSRAAWLAGLA